MKHCWDKTSFYRHHSKGVSMEWAPAQFWGPFFRESEVARVFAIGKNACVELLSEAQHHQHKQWDVKAIQAWPTPLPSPLPMSRVNCGAIVSALSAQYDLVGNGTLTQKCRRCKKSPKLKTHAPNRLLLPPILAVVRFRVLPIPQIIPCQYSMTIQRTLLWIGINKSWLVQWFFQE